MSFFSLRNPATLAVLATILLLLIAGTVAIVPETSQAVVLRFGKVERIYNPYKPGEAFGRTGAGLKIRMPLLDRIVWIDKRVQNVDMQRQQVLDTGEIFTMATARGPMCTAGFARNTSDFMIDLVEKPEYAHKLLDLCTRLIIDWLKAQVKVMGPTVEGIFLLDDIVGFVNEDHYREFCHPYLKRICDAFTGANLEQVLREAGIQRLVTCGIQSDFCVDAATRGAMNRGFDVTLAADAHTTWDNGILTAEQIITHVNATLPNMSGPGPRIRIKRTNEIAFYPVDA